MYNMVRYFLFEKKYFLCCKLHDRNILHVFLRVIKDGHNWSLIWRWIKKLVKRTLLQSDAPHMHQYERDWRPRIAAQHTHVVCSAYSRSVRSGLYIFFWIVKGAVYHEFFQATSLGTFDAITRLILFWEYKIIHHFKGNWMTFNSS